MGRGGPPHQGPRCLGPGQFPPAEGRARSHPRVPSPRALGSRYPALAPVSSRTGTGCRLERLGGEGGGGERLDAGGLLPSAPPRWVPLLRLCCHYSIRSSSVCPVRSYPTNPVPPLRVCRALPSATANHRISPRCLPPKQSGNGEEHRPPPPPFRVRVHSWGGGGRESSHRAPLLAPH